MRYLYIHKEWPHFRWNAERLVPYLSAARYKQGRLLGKMQDLGYQLKKEATLLALTEETVKSSAIEGEELNPESVRSSLARRMSVDVSERQREVLSRLLDGFDGKLTTDKWAKLTKSSHGTALRDIQDLIRKGILKQEEGGRST